MFTRQSKVFLSFTSFFLLFYSSLVNADRNRDIETIFNWAEQKYPSLFLPVGTATQILPDFDAHSWHYRYYAETDTYMGINDKDKVYVLGNQFGGLSYVDLMSSVLMKVNNSNDDGNSGNGSCANIPLVSRGLKMTNRVFVGTSKIDHEIEFIEVTETFSKKKDKEISSFSGIKNNLVEDIYVIADNYMKISSTKISRPDKPDVSPTIVINTPSVRKAINEVCVNQTWHDEYELSSTIDGVPIVTIKNSLKNSIEAVNESITTSAGTFNTVRIKHNLKSIESFSWISTEHGIKVRGGHYNNGKFIGEEELISLE